MLRNYIIIAFRNIWRNKVYSLINILGLAIGIAACLLILLYVNFEYGFDRFHKDGDRIYRVFQQFGDDASSRMTSSGGQMGPMMVKDFPEIESSVRMHRKNARIQLEQEGEIKIFKENLFAFADSQFFDFFSFELLQGNPATVLNKPFQLVISRSAAEKYFGDTDPIGKTLNIDKRFDYTITGIMEDMPTQSHIRYEMVASMASLFQFYNIRDFASWWWPATYTFVKAHPQADIKQISEERLKSFINQYREADNTINPRLQALHEVRFQGLFGDDGSASYVYMFFSIALVVLMIACMNFMNLATARSAKRATEVGIRKVVGARRGNLISQFLGESLVITLISIILGVGLAELTLPLFNQVAGLDLKMEWAHPFLWISLVGILIGVGLLAGSYPALFLSSFKPLKVLKGGKSSAKGGRKLREGLVVMQFVISVSLIICTIMIYRQHQYMLSKSLGYDQSRLLTLQMNESAVVENFSALKTSLLSIPQVEHVTRSNWKPGDNNLYDIPAQIEYDNGEMKYLEERGILYVGQDFFETLGLELQQGRWFSPEYVADTGFAYVINEKALEHMGEGPYLDRKVSISYGEYGNTLYKKDGKVVGVIKDFHSVDLRMPIRPYLITLATKGEANNNISYCLVRLKAGDMRPAIERISQSWEELFGPIPLDLSFPEEDVAATYAHESQLGNILAAFAILAIFIACLGLLGLAAFTAQQRTKEIGIRKVLGASAPNIIMLLNRRFTLLVLISLVVSFPLAYYLIDIWMEDYPYQVAFSLWPFVLAGLAALGISWLTVGFQSLKAALLDPVLALRYE